MRVYIVVFSAIAIYQAHAHLARGDTPELRVRPLLFARDLDITSPGLESRLIPLSKRSPRGSSSPPLSETDSESEGERRGHRLRSSPPASPVTAARAGPTSQRSPLRDSQIGSGPNARNTVDRALAGAAAVASRNRGPPTQVRLGMNHAFSIPLDMSHIPPFTSYNSPARPLNGLYPGRNTGASTRSGQLTTLQGTGSTTSLSLGSNARSLSPSRSDSEG